MMIKIKNHGYHVLLTMYRVPTWIVSVDPHNNPMRELLSFLRFTPADGDPERLGHVARQSQTPARQPPEPKLLVTVSASFPLPLSPNDRSEIISRPSVQIGKSRCKQRKY